MESPWSVIAERLRSARATVTTDRRLSRPVSALVGQNRALILTLLLLTGCGGAARAAAGTPAQQRCDLSAETQALAVEFVRLRAVLGHFRGDTWTSDADDWMGRKHQVMIELGSRLGVGGCRPAEITGLLGLPDLIAALGETLFEQVTNEAEFEEPVGEAYELLIYLWRGEHDFLYFTSAGGAIVGSGWWHAYE